METYKNSYTKDEDFVLWELHEIRHKLHKRKINQSIEDRNKEALITYHNWQKEREYKQKENKV
jgi:hypothetical protein